jgi:hypothetical protein
MAICFVVHFQKIQRVSAVNIEMGYKLYIA